MKYILAALIAVGLIGGMVTANIKKKLEDLHSSSHLGDTSCYSGDYSTCPSSYKGLSCNFPGYPYHYDLDTQTCSAKNIDEVCLGSYDCNCEDECVIEVCSCSIDNAIVKNPCDSW